MIRFPSINACLFVSCVTLIVTILCHEEEHERVTIGTVAKDKTVPAQLGVDAEFQARRDLADEVSNDGDHLKAIKILEELLSEVEARHPKGDLETVWTLRDLAAKSFHAKQFPQAVVFQRRSYEICKRVAPPSSWNDPNHFTALLEATMMMGRVQITNNAPEKFRQYLTEAIEVLESCPYDPDVMVANLRAQIGMGLKRCGESELANEFCLKAVCVADRFVDRPESPKFKIVQIYWLSASQFFDVSDIALAKQYASKAVDMIDRGLVEPNPQLKTESLQILGKCYANLGAHKQAISCFETAYSEIKGFDKHNAAGIARNLAEANFAAGNLVNAERWLKIAKSYDVGTQRDIRYRFTDAQIHLAKGEWQQARELLLDSLRARRADEVGMDETSEVLALLGKLDFARGQVDSAQEWLEQSRKVQTAVLEQLLAKASEAAVVSYLHHDWRKVTDLYLEVTQQLDDPEQVLRQYELVSQQRGLVVRTLAARNRIRRNLRGRGRELYNEYLRLSNELATAIRHGELPEIGSRSNQLRTEIEVLETEMAKHTPELLEQIRSLITPVKRIQETLDRTEVLIDFVRFSVDQQDQYAVFVVTPNRVFRTQVSDADALHQKVHAWRAAIEQGHGDHLAKEVHASLWKPAEAFIPSEADTLYVCGDGELLLVPWNALRRTDESILLEHYAIATPPHPQHLLTKPRAQKVAKGQLLAVGNIAFGNHPGKATSRARASKWRQLEHTRTEISALSRRASNAGFDVTVLDGSKATASNVSENLPTSYWIHLATHGFHASDPDDPDVTIPLFADRMHPLTSKGLVLAGANDGDSDGLLNGTAISNLDLEKAEMVFLSACDSGIGDVFDGEGIYGLQRAFHAAGARNVICSLWQVDDAATALLVERFYKNYWSQNMSPLHALRAAQLELYKNPLLHESFKQKHSKMHSHTRGLKRRPSTAKGEKQSLRLPTALWAGFVFSGSGTIARP